MIESILGVPLPSQLAGEQRRSSVAGSDEKLVVVQQAYEVLELHENMFDLCKLLCVNGGVRLVAVEGANGQVEFPSALRGASIRDLVLHSELSGGILKLLDSDLAGINVFGVDNLALVEESRQAMHTLLELDAVRERAFDAIRDLLHEAQLRFYPPPLAQLRRETLAVTNPALSLELKQQIALIKESARQVQLPFEELTAIARLEQILHKENEIDFARVEAQRELAVTLVVEHIFDWRRAVSQGEEVDRQLTQQIVRHWAAAVDLSQAELGDMIRRVGLRQTLLECAEWLGAAFFEGALDARLTGLHGPERNPHTAFYRLMLQLARRLGIDPAQIEALEAYSGYLADAIEQMTPHGMLGAFTESSIALIERLASPEAAWLREVEEQLDACYRALCVKLTPDDAEVADIKPGQLLRLVDALCSRLDKPARRQTSIALMDAMLEPAGVFLRCSRERSRHMIDSTLALMRAQGLDRAILSVGGFHARAITQALEEHRHLSWSVLQPVMNMDKHRQYLDIDPEYRRRYGRE